MNNQNIRAQIRNEKKKMRLNQPLELQIKKSNNIVNKILTLPEFQKAKNILIYNAIKGEVRLDSLINAVDMYNKKAPASVRKTLLFPLCISNTEMIALAPQDSNAWVTGAYGITEPDRNRSTLYQPEDIDLAICPCTVFDEDCNRMGMGAGFYDRYLPKCINASIISVAYEFQKVDHVPVDEWDKPMGKTVTEEQIYTATSH